MKRLPFWPTLIVGVAVVVMIGLGIWQLQRLDQKRALLAHYESNLALPPVAFPSVPPTDGSLFYRRASGACLEVVSWSARAGANRKGESGWRHIAACRTGAEGPGLHADMGWSQSFDAPKGFTGGPVSGVIDQDRDHILLLVAETPAPGLQPSANPTPADIPNNHLAYAVQWFLFAGLAVLIYALALRRRRKGAGASPPSSP